MNVITASQFTRKFNQVCSLLAREEAVIVTRYGKPIAMVNRVKQGRLDRALEFSRLFRELAASEKRRERVGLDEARKDILASQHPARKPLCRKRPKQE